MKKKKTRRVGALLLAMMMLFTTLPVTARAEAPETEMPGVEESVNAAPATEQQSENAGNGKSTKEDAMPEDEATVSGVHHAPAPTMTKNLTVKVTLDTTMKMIMDQTQSYTFLVNGKEYEIPVTSPTGLGPVTFTATFHDVPFQEGQAEAEVYLEKLPFCLEENHSIIEQGYNPSTQKLNIVLGREVYIKVSDLKEGLIFETFGTNMVIQHSKLALYDEQGTTRLQESTDAGEYGCKFTKLKPGTYKVKVKSLPGGEYKNEDYDLDRFYTLTIADNGFPRLEIYQKDGSYHVVKANGASESVLPTDPLLNGSKSPLLLVIARKSKAQKRIIKDEDALAKLEVEKGDIVEYKITKTIHGDHNTVVEFGKYVNIGAKVNQSFTDVLSPDLELIEPIQVNLDGEDTQEFVASYDRGTRTITVSDQSSVNVVHMDFSTKTKIPKDQTLEVTFKVKVKEANKSIFNTVDDSTTELIPFTVKVEKHWEDQGNRAGKRPEFVQIQLKADGKVIKTVKVTALSDWKYTFTGLRKKNDEGKEIEYTVEELPVDGYKTSIAGDVQNGFTVTNKFLPPPPPPRIEDVSIPVEKVWEDDGNRENLRPTSVTVRLYADGKDTGKSVVLTEANGWKGRFDALPKYDAGKRITYTVKEERVAHYDSSVSGDQTDGFTVTNRIEPKPPTPPTPPTPPIPPTTLVPRIPRAGVGA